MDHLKQIDNALYSIQLAPNEIHLEYLIKTLPDLYNRIHFLYTYQSTAATRSLENLHDIYGKRYSSIPQFSHLKFINKNINKTVEASDYIAYEFMVNEIPQSNYS